MLHEAMVAGLGQPDVALAINRMAVGTFFAISGWHKLVVPARHAALVHTLRESRIPLLKFNEWWVPTVELVAGAAVALGVYAPVAALFLLAICLVACFVDGVKRVEQYAPINAADRVDDWLYLPETLYAVMLLIVVFAGSGRWALL